MSIFCLYSVLPGARTDPEV